MKSTLLLFTSLSLLLCHLTSERSACAQGASDSTPSQVNQNNNANGVGAIVTPGKKPATDPIYVRGWEIQTAAAVKRGTVKEVFPAFDQKKRVGNAEKATAPARGQFLIVAVTLKWATGQPPNEPLWAGKPDVTLIDDVGFEYPAIDVVTKVGADFVPASIAAIPQREKRGKEQSKAIKVLIYFDIPTGGQNFWLKFAPNVPMLPVTQVNDLP